MRDLYLVIKEEDNEILATFNNVEDSVDYGRFASVIFDNVIIAKIEINLNEIGEFVSDMSLVATAHCGEVVA